MAVERGHLLVEGQVGQRGAAAVGHAPLAALLEQLVDLCAAGPAQIAEQLGGEVAVALGEQGLGRRRQLVDGGPAGPGRRLVAVAHQAVLLQAPQLLADGGRA